MKFAWIIHPVGKEEMYKSSLAFGVLGYLWAKSQLIRNLAIRHRYIHSFAKITEIVSLTNDTCSGEVFVIPCEPREILDNQVLALSWIEQACSKAAKRGAEIISLGGMTGIVGSRGRYLQSVCPLCITTGNSCTVYSSISALDDISRRLNFDLRKEVVTVIGFPGSIALAIARILAEKGIDLILLSRRDDKFIQRYISEYLNGYKIRLKLTMDLGEAIKNSKIICSATSSGNVLDPDKLLPGSIVIDIAVPHDVIYKGNLRKDVLIIDGGIMSLPQKTKIKFKLPNLERPNYIHSCLAEAMILALEKRKENFSIGRVLALERIKEIGKLAEKHGFETREHFSFSKRIDESTYEMVKKHI